MKIGIVHLTDIHFSEKTTIENRTESFVRVIINDMISLKNLYFVISGDIAFSGKKEEYKKAKGFLSVVKQMLIAEMPHVVIKHIVVLKSSPKTATY